MATRKGRNVAESCGVSVPARTVALAARETSSRHSKRGFRPRAWYGALLVFFVLLVATCDRRTREADQPSSDGASRPGAAPRTAVARAAGVDDAAAGTPHEPDTTKGDTQPASGGWGTVAWGSSEEQVRAAYPAAVAISPPDDYDRTNALATLRLSNVEAAGLSFDALFLFDKAGSGLKMVLLRREPREPFEYERLFQSLSDKYGSPARSKSLNTASLDTSSPQQAAKTRIGSGSAEWLTNHTRVGLEYLEAIGVRHLIVSYTNRTAESNL